MVDADPLDDVVKVNQHVIDAAWSKQFADPAEKTLFHRRVMKFPIQLEWVEEIFG